MLKDILQYLQYIVDWITLHFKVLCTTVHDVSTLLPSASSNWYNALQQVKAVAF